MFTSTLLQWFDQHHRQLPWRGETDPYKIWISEIILQQTRVVQGIGYYHRFLETFPTVTALATADEADVLKVWQGLGYYSRARNLHAAAKSIQQDFNGKFPSNYHDIRKLKGVGNYTAAAIASIAFALPYPAVDGNVLRFVARYNGIFDNIATEATRKTIESVCQKWIPSDCPGTFNQAMMEMGATLCTPKNPDCENCPFATHCFAAQNQQVEQLPVKEQTLKIKNRFFHYLVFIKDNCTILQKRTSDDIWKNLYEFPLEETQCEQFDICNYLKINNIQTIEEPKLVWQTKHQLTHRNIFAFFYVVQPKKLPQVCGSQMVIKVSDFDRFAVAKVTEKAVREIFTPARSV